MSDWKRIIIAIDDSPRSLNAVDYVGSIAGHLRDIRLCLLHIYPEPPPGFYQSGATLDDYKREQEERATALFEKAGAILQSHGVSPQAIATRCRIAGQQSISAAILELQTQKGYGTIVVGKRGISKAEEFLFGSISNALIHNGRDIAVWVIG
ncbi:universal stress protein [Desulfobulbus elongatus]|uniref:universal stress protein n=1 Tax=Desulfobulbus elongatus TaxID=53332 RepID=UPI000559939F|nr:universal stress protein [Desulfobulbus elongatus]